MRRVFDIVYWMDICQLCVMYVGLETSLVFILHVLYSIHSNSASKSAPSYSICPPWVPSTPENVLSSIASGSCANASDVRVHQSTMSAYHVSSQVTELCSSPNGPRWPKFFYGASNKKRCHCEAALSCGLSRGHQWLEADQLSQLQHLLSAWLQPGQNSFLKKNWELPCLQILHMVKRCKTVKI